MNILLEGIFYNGHGFAEGNRILLRILDQAGYRVRIAARDKAECGALLSPQEIRYISSFETNELPSNDLYICNMPGSFVRYRPDFRINIARTTFETDRIPGFWVPELNKFDEVWVQSAFNLRTFKSSGVTVPLRFVPNFFDASQYDPQGETLRLPVNLNSSFLFLSVFDLQDRKGYDVLIRAFLNEFSRDENAALVIKIRDHLGSRKLEHLIESHPKPNKKKPPVYVIDQMLSASDLLRLYRTCNAFVLPSRGEGWGRPFFEAMLMEMPVIGTGWSGQTEFMIERNAFLVRVERLVRIKDCDVPIFNGHYWAEPSLADLQKKMRYVYEHPEEAKAIGRRARSDLLQSYGMRQIARRVTKEIDKFYKRGKRKVTIK